MYTFGFDKKLFCSILLYDTAEVDPVGTHISWNHNFTQSKVLRTVFSCLFLWPLFPSLAPFKISLKFCFLDLPLLRAY